MPRRGSEAAGALVRSLASAGILLGLTALTLWLRGAPGNLAFLEERAQGHVLRAVAERIQAESDGSLEASVLEQRVARWAVTHPQELEARVARARESLREPFGERDASGRWQPFASGFDAHHWLWRAQRLQASGSQCDPPPSGRSERCWDAFTLAPVGAPLAYPDSAHVRALVGAQRLGRWLDPGLRDSVSAEWMVRGLCALIVCMTFALGRTLGGTLGGVCAALLVASAPEVLRRTFEADNDAWNLLLPLSAVAFCAWALGVRSRWARALLAVAAGATLALHASLWRGWLLGGLVVLAGLGLHAVLEGFRFSTAVRSAGPQAAPRGSLASACAVPALVVATLLVGAGPSMAEGWRGLVGELRDVVDWLAPAGEPRAGASGADVPAATKAPATFPDAFGAVRELERVPADEVRAAVGGRAVFLAALAGLLAAALPRRPWTRSQTAVAVLGAALLLAADTAGSWRGEPLVGRTMAAGVALPALLALGAGLGSAREPGRRAAAALLTAWLAAALALAWGGPGRFLMLLPVPVALAIAALVGRLFEALRETDASGGPPLRGLLLAASLAVPMLLVAGSLYAGRALARLQSPILDRAWSQILHEIRDRSPADAVVTAWWDYGHWIKHRTGRRVLHDGTSLRTPVPFWVARALASEDPDEGLGILRMLHCGSDTRGLVDPPGGAAAELTSLGVAPQRLVPLIRELVSSDRAGAEARLAREGLDAAQRLRVLERTHCSPPPGVLLVNGELAGGEPIRELAAWTAPGETGRVAPTERWLVSRLLADPAPQLPGLERLAEERDSRGQRLRAFSIRWPTPSAP